MDDEEYNPHKLVPYPTYTVQIGTPTSQGNLNGTDILFRRALQEAWIKTFGDDADDPYIFSGWGTPLPERYKAVIENREPDLDVLLEEAGREITFRMAVERKVKQIKESLYENGYNDGYADAREQYARINDDG